MEEEKLPVVQQLNIEPQRKSTPPRFRNWLCTWNNPGEDWKGKLLELWEKSNNEGCWIKYMAGQLEVCPTTGTRHI